ncbi:MAG TPA: YbaB/EbfC family nucleoid-associated protein [Flavilitoribacter sp.]|nr:YbaB/EbfC family nucleoid-associated protein [Flavilitoribacter sp.]
MFGDLFGQMEEQQKAIKEKLAAITVEAESGDGAVKVTATAARQLLNITINPEAIHPEDPEELEDLILVAVNRALELAAAKESEESQKLIQDMLPPGFGGLFG